ncbi:metalloenzyme superfamily-domain-containing protein [Mycena capillaripes]|nr:metalloenzyme superfamily-domain-containing protein [Mycena capillaripes]
MSLVEPQKYVHVPFFFNGGVKRQFPGEERFVIPSPKVTTHDLQPEISGQGVADKVASIVERGEYDFMMYNFTPPDLVGDTYNFYAVVFAITPIERMPGGVCLITADHGNAEHMCDPETGALHTAHTCNPVPFFFVERKARTRRRGQWVVGTRGRRKALDLLCYTPGADRTRCTNP